MVRVLVVASAALFCAALFAGCADDEGRTIWFGPFEGSVSTNADWVLVANRESPHSLSWDGTTTSITDGAGQPRRALQLVADVDEDKGPVTLYLDEASLQPVAISYVYLDPVETIWEFPEWGASFGAQLFNDLLPLALVGTQTGQDRTVDYLGQSFDIDWTDASTFRARLGRSKPMEYHLDGGFAIPRLVRPTSGGNASWESTLQPSQDLGLVAAPHQAPVASPRFVAYDGLVPDDAPSLLSPSPRPAYEAARTCSLGTVCDPDVQHLVSRPETFVRRATVNEFGWAFWVQNEATESDFTQDFGFGVTPVPTGLLPDAYVVQNITDSSLNPWGDPFLFSSWFPSKPLQVATLGWAKEQCRAWTGAADVELSYSATFFGWSDITAFCYGTSTSVRIRLTSGLADYAIQR